MVSPEEIVAGLRAKAAQLEHAVDDHAVLNVHSLAADLAALYTLVADHVERTGWTVLVEVEDG